MAFELAPIQPEIEVTGFHSIYYFEFGKDFYHLPEKHDFWELVYVDYGSIHAIVDGAGCELNKGQVIFHQPPSLTMLCQRFSVSHMFKLVTGISPTDYRHSVND